MWGVPVIKINICSSNPKEGDDVVFGNGLQESGSAGQWLEACATCWEERANHNDPRSWPSQSPHNQIPFDWISKSARAKNIFTAFIGDKNITTTVFLNRGYAIKIISLSHAWQNITRGQIQEQMYWLVSEDHPFNAGSKQNNVAQVWMDKTQENNTQQSNQIKSSQLCLRCLFDIMVQ